MKLLKRLSIKTMVEEFKRTCYRFPLPVIFSIITTILLIIEMENYTFFNNSPLLIKSIFVSILGFSFTLVSTLFIEKSENKDKIKFITQLLVLSLLAYLFMTLPSKFRECDYITFSTFLMASFFALMFVYTKNEKDESYFGIYNITLFMRGFTSFVFAVILFSGLASAVFAVQELFFKENFHTEIYGDIWVLIIAFFAPLYFLGGIPNKNEHILSDFSFPKALKILLQYILVPLVSLYMLILYSYIIKIISTQIWPEGIVSYLIISYSLVGIVSIILLSPLNNSELFKWINTFSRYFFRALLPLIIVLFMAIFKRISQYGVTEKRYFILILSFWLAGITLYMVFGKKKVLKILPITLSILSVLSLYGPWSCFSVSKFSQKSILKELLMKNYILVNDKIIKTEKAIPFTDRKSISSIVSYFYDNHGVNKIEFLNDVYLKLASESKDDNAKNDEYNFYRDQDEAVSRKKLIKQAFGFDYVDNWQTENTSNFLNIAVKYYHDPILEDISGYDSFIDCRDNEIKDRIFDKINDIYLRYDAKDFLIVFEKGSNDTLAVIDLKVSLNKIIADNMNLGSGNQLDPADMKAEVETDSINYMLLFRNFSAKRESEKEPYKIENVYFSLYYTVK